MIHATNAYCRSHGIKPTINAAAFDTLDPATLVAVARAAAIPETLTSAYARYLFHEFRAAPEQSPIFPGIPKLLENLKHRYTIAIVSANHSGVIRKRLQAAGLEQNVHLLMGNESEGTKSDQIQVAMAQTGTFQERTWLIGDTVSDIGAARAARGPRTGRYLGLAIKSSSGPPCTGATVRHGRRSQALSSRNIDFD